MMQDVLADENVVLRDHSPRNRVAMYLRDLILTGKIGPGETLPTERQISDSLMVARGTVRAALMILEGECLIVRRKHAKRVVAPPMAAQINLLAQTYVLLTHLSEVPSVKSESGLLGAVEAGVFGAGREAGLHSMLLQQNCLYDGYFEKILQSKPYGVLVTSHLFNDPTITGRLQKIFRSVKSPALVLNSAELDLPDCDRVVFDHCSGSAMLTRFLLSQGKQRILRLWSGPADSSIWLQERNRGHERIMGEAGVSVLPCMHVDYLPSDRSQFVARARCYAGALVECLRKPQPPQAIMVTSDADVFVVAAACQLCGVEPGRDIMIVGYDDSWREAPERHEINYIPPVSANKRNFIVGEAMLQLLQRRRKEPSLSPQTIFIAPEIIYS